MIAVQAIEKNKFTYFLLKVKQQIFSTDVHGCIFIRSVFDTIFAMPCLPKLPADPRGPPDEPLRATSGARTTLSEKPILKYEYGADCPVRATVLVFILK
jgi:hypothetical protein